MFSTSTWDQKTGSPQVASFAEQERDGCDRTNPPTTGVTATHRHFLPLLNEKFDNIPPASVRPLAASSMSFVSALVFALSGTSICYPPTPVYRADTATAVKSLASNILRQSKAEIRRRFAESVPITPPSCSLQTICPSQVLETSTLQLSPATRLPQSSPIARLPQELVDAIISYFIYHTRVLLVCSLACHSWYLAAVPHLHHSLTTDELIYCQEDKKYQWSTPLQQSHDLGLLPLVKRLRVRMLPLDKFTPERLCGYNLHYFSALTNLQELGIDDLQVSSFMPNIKQCFGHLAPTLRFLALREPERSPRQILYFIGLFPNLQGLKLYHSLSKKEPGSLTDADLIPLSVPPLRGRLTLSFFTNVRLVKDMMAIFGGLHFRSMDLFRVKCTQLLLEACAETLETLRLYPTDTHGKGLFEGKEVDS